MDGSFSHRARRLGALSLFGIGVVFASAAYQMISLENPNAPIALARQDPLYAAQTTTTTPPSRMVVEGGSPDVEVLGSTEELSTPSGLGLGEWAFFQRDQFTRFIFTETSTGTVLTVVLPSGDSTEHSLVEDDTADGGRLFTYAGETSDETFFIGDDGNLSLGTADGVWVTLGATS